MNIQDVIPALKHPESHHRIAAKETAIANCRRRVGDEPRFDDFLAVVQSEMPAEFEKFTRYATLVVFFAAFVISGIHIFTAAWEISTGYAGIVTFAVAFSAFLLAESAQIAASLRLAAVDKRASKIALWAVILTSTTIAFCGNVVSGIIAHTNQPMAWVLGLGVPIITGCLSYSLKDDFLRGIKREARAHANFKHALEEYRRRTAEEIIISSRDYRQDYANELKRLYMQLNSTGRDGEKKEARMSILYSLDENGWTALIVWNIKQDYWFPDDDPTPQSTIEVSPVQIAQPDQVAALPKPAGRLCKQCGNSIDHKRANALYCDEFCKDEYHNAQRKNTDLHALTQIPQSVQDDVLTP